MPLKYLPSKPDNKALCIQAPADQRQRQQENFSILKETQFGPRKHSAAQPSFFANYLLRVLANHIIITIFDEMQRGPTQLGTIIEKEDDRLIVEFIEPGKGIFKWSFCCCLWGDESICCTGSMVCLNMLTCWFGGCVFMVSKKCCCPSPRDVKERRMKEFGEWQQGNFVRIKYIFSKVSACSNA